MHHSSCSTIPTLFAHSQEKLLGHLGVVLYEYLGEEYPEVLGSILGGLKSIVNVIGMTKMTPPIKDLLPRLTPILKNRSCVCVCVWVCVLSVKGWHVRRSVFVAKNKYVGLSCTNVLAYDLLIIRLAYHVEIGESVVPRDGILAIGVLSKKN